MKHLSGISLLAFCILAVSCAKEKAQTDLSEQQNDKLVPVTFIATYPAPEDSKTELDGQGNVSWKKGDEITIYYLNKGLPVTVTAAAEADGSTVQFSAYIPENAKPECFYAAYPAGSGILGKDGRFAINTDVVTDGSFENTNFSAAYTLPSSQLCLKFKNVVGLYRVQLPSGAVLSHGGKDYKLSSVAITDKKADVPCAGKVFVNVEDGQIKSLSAPADSVCQVCAMIGEKAITAGYAYIQSAPVSYPDGLVIRFSTEDGSVIPALATKDGNEIVVQNSHVKPIDGAYDNIIWDWYFSTDGKGDGKSQSNPGNTAAFVSLLNSTEDDYRQWILNGAVIHLADGRYIIDNQIVLKGKEKVEIFIEGQSKENTVIDGTNLGSVLKLQPVKSTSAGALHLKTLAIEKSTSNSNGAAISYTGSGVFTVENCRFSDNLAPLGNSGALYLGGASGHVLRGCEFTGNQALSYGGAFAIGGSSKGRTVVDDCRFYRNQAIHTADTKKGFGGAAYCANLDSTFFNNCVFEENSANMNGGAIFSNKSGAVIFINRSLFTGNTVTRAGYASYGAAIYTSKKTTKLGVFNCTFDYNHSSAASSASSVIFADQYVIANSTFVETSPVSYGVINNQAVSSHTSTLANNIVINTSETETHPALSCSNDAQYNYLDSRNNLVTRIQAAFTAASADGTTKVGATKSSFGFGDVVDKTNKCYAWNGDVSTFTGYTKCATSDIENLVKTNTSIGKAFWTWLEKTLDASGNDATQVDVRGVRRSEPVWPGSYQDNN